MVVLHTVIKFCLEASELKNSMLFSILIKRSQVRKPKRMDWRFCRSRGRKGRHSKGFATSKFFFSHCGTNPDNLPVLEDG